MCFNDSGMVRELYIYGVVVVLLTIMADEEEGSELPKVVKLCFMHFKDVKESTCLITKQRLEKFVSCRRKWISLDGEHGEICRGSYNLFSDELLGQEKINSDNFDLEWYYHKACYKRLCDEEKIRRAEAKAKRTINDRSSKETDDDKYSTTDHDDNQHAAPCRKLTRLETKRSSMAMAAEPKQRNSFVLPERCIICLKGSNWFQQDKVSDLDF